MEPPLPPVAPPVDNVIAPLEPALLTPVFNDIAPLAPLEPDTPVEIETSPLDFDTPLPLVSEIEPPVVVALAPATRDIRPPSVPGEIVSPA
jgi:hypothetical protein